VNQNTARKIVVITSDSQIEHASADLAIQVRFGHFYRRGSLSTETKKPVAFQELLSAEVIVLLLDPKWMFRSRSNPGSIREVKIEHLTDRALQSRFDGSGFESAVEGA
jgi:hypothetical protein